MTNALSLTVVLLLLAFSVNGATILDVPASTRWSALVLGGSENEIIAQSFSSAIPYSNVTIAVEIGSASAQFAQGTAWLTTRIGPGTTAADIQATTGFTAPLANDHNVVPPLTVLFNGLSLSSGTYYLVLEAPAGPNTLDGPLWLVWNQISGITVGPGVSNA